MMLVTLDEVKQYLEISGTEQDEKLNLLLAAADSYIKDECGREFEYNTFIEYTKFSNGVVFLRETPIESIVSITDLDGNSYSHEYLDKENGILILADKVDFEAEIEYIGGYQVIPADLKMAVIRIVEYLLSSSEGTKSVNLEGLAASFGDVSSYVMNVIDKYRGMWI